MRVRASRGRSKSSSSGPFFAPELSRPSNAFFAGPAPAVQAKCCVGGASAAGTGGARQPIVGSPTDRLEHQADRMADRVMRMSPAGVTRCGGLGRADAAVSAGAGSGRGTPGGRGQALPGATRRFFEPRFDRDFSDVRIHTGPAAARLARGLNARAFTIGRDIVFGAGQYSPATTTGKRLLAHELAHRVQQQEGQGPRNVIRRRWDRAATECAGVPREKWLERVVVEQESPQSVTLHWSDGGIESGQCSSGKGHCCVDPATPEGVACSVSGSRVDGSNCTPITERSGYAVKHRDLDHKGIRFWTEFVPSRGIALHAYAPVDGTPLSHGCVRLNEGTARRIFCGARQDRTRVQVQGFARPDCSRASLRREWLNDFAEGGQDLSALDGDRDRRRAVLETRRMLNEAFGRVLTVAEIRALTANHIPVCGATVAARPTAEEQALTARIVRPPGGAVVAQSPPAQGTVPARILAASRFDRFLVPFTAGLSAAGNLRSARRLVLRHGRGLWNAATRRAQASAGAGSDDRPLHQARLQMSRALRQWAAPFSLSPQERADLLDRFERASRGMETATHRGRGMKRILISGFDPFDLRPFRGRSGAPDIRRSNPSGAAVLALDGQTISSGSIRAQVQGVIFPVRFADFDAGVVENFFRPFIDGATPVDMIMTISQGSSVFEVERFAGRRRSSENFPGNLGQVGGGTPGSPVEPPGLAAGPEFLRTTLPEQAIHGALGGSRPLPEETEITEIPHGASRPVTRPAGGPTAGSTAVRGSGGGFLSNEIFYRTALLRTRAESDLPLGHLHVPRLDLPAADALSSARFEADREAIIHKVKLILEAALPML